MSMKRFRKGDTIIEVTISILVFSIVAIISVGIMDRSMATAQENLELNMTRNEIDAQAEAIRFIHNSFLAERELVKEGRVYQELWQTLVSSKTGMMNNPAKIADFRLGKCEDAYNGSHPIIQDKAFVINTRKINPKDISGTVISTNKDKEMFRETKLYPRLIFSKKRGEIENEGSDKLQEGADLTQDEAPLSQVASVEGVWVVATRDMTNFNNVETINDEVMDEIQPQFYDFHIRSCWYGPGKSRPTTIATIIRLYNPEHVEKVR